MEVAALVLAMAAIDCGYPGLAFPIGFICGVAGIAVL